MNLQRLFLLSLLFFTAVFAPKTAVAQNNNVTLTASAGYDSYYKGEFWIPIHVSVANNGPDIEGSLQVVVGTSFPGEAVVYNAPLSLPTQSNKRLTLYVSANRYVSSFNVVLLDSTGDKIAEDNTDSLSLLALDALLYGVVSSDPGELEFLQNVTGGRAEAAVAFLDVTDLPEIGVVWSALDVLIFNDVDTGQLTADQLNALRGWVSLGGQLVITGGANWQKTAASLTDLLPVSISSSESIAELPALSSFAGLPFRDPGPYVVATSSLQSGELLIHQDGLPLLARQPFGRGSVYFLALDPRLAPLLDWDGSEQVWYEIANRLPVLPTWGQRLRDGYSAGTAVASNPSLAVPSTSQLVLFLIIYVVVIGPVNYLVLKRYNRRELAWVSIPALIFLFSSATYLTGFQLKGNTTLINQMSVAYGQVGAEQMRVQSLLGIYSPRRSTYDLILPGDVVAYPFNRNSGSMEPAGAADAVTRGNELVLSDVVVDVGDTAAFLAESYRPMPDITAEVVMNITGARNELTITVQNNSDITLENAVLMLGFTTIRLGNLESGATFNQTQIVPFSLLSSTTTYSGYTTPLASNAEVLLGTADYQNNRDTFPRWQLLIALEGNYYGGVGNIVMPENAVTLVGWSDTPQLDAAVDREAFTTRHTTLYLLEIPVRQSVSSGETVMVPVSLLNWEVLRNTGGAQPALFNLYLYNGSIEYQFTPWAEFQQMTVTGLEINIQADTTYSGSPLLMDLYDWQARSWVQITGFTMGRVAIEDFGRFIGPQNAVQIRLETSSSVTVQEIYPVLTGKFE